MSRSTQWILVLTCFALLGSSVAVAQDAGTVVGRVFDPAGEILVAAEVRVEGTTLVAVTDDTGQFRLSRCPPAPRSWW